MKSVSSIVLYNRKCCQYKIRGKIVKGRIEEIERKRERKIER